ncbi:hypothetical protein KSS87_000280, partial [Heliosperma pusillum]
MNIPIHAKQNKRAKLRKINQFSRLSRNSVDRLNPSSQSLNCLNTSLHIISFSSVHPVSSI